MKYLPGSLKLLFGINLMFIVVFTVDASGQGNTRDTTVQSLRAFLSEGQVHGHIRDFFMATVNEDMLNDYWTNALGGKLAYETAEWKGLKLGMAVNASFRTFSSDLNRIDSLVNRSAVWERELYDIFRPEAKYDIIRLEEMYVRYGIGLTTFSYGRMNINRSPLLLSRDGRMMPFAFSGFWAESRELDDHHFVLGWINGVSIRGTVGWDRLKGALGQLPNGLQPDGSKADYYEAVNTNGLLVFNYTNLSVPGLKMELWNYFFGKVMNTVWFQADWKHENLKAGIQYVHQTGLPAQRELPYSRRYIQPDQDAQVVSAMASYTLGPVEIGGAYLHAFRSGRFLFPREMGREAFYTSQPRSWLDGLGETDIWMIRLKMKDENTLKGFSVDFRTQYVQTPGLGKPEFNKYNLIPYLQFYTSLEYEFSGKLQGLGLQFLLISRKTPKSIEYELTDLYYRSNFHNFNFIVNMEF